MYVSMSGITNELSSSAKLIARPLWPARAVRPTEAGLLLYERAQAILQQSEETLRALEEKGILIRTVYAQIPPRVEYTLTNLGYNLKPVLDSMRAWAEEYYNQNVKNLMPELAQ